MRRIFGRERKRICGIRTGVLIGAISLASVIGMPLHAATYTWISSGDSNWSNGLNWTGGVPTAAVSTILSFGSGSQTTTVNDITSLIANSLVFSGSANSYSISGNALTFAANGSTTPAITQSASTASSINLPINWSGTTLNLNGSGSGALTLSGILTGTTAGSTAANLTKSGSSQMTLTGVGSAITGGLSVTGGSLTISGGGTLSSSTGRINSTSGGSGTVTVTGSGSVWNNSSTLIVGDTTGSTGTLNITNSATVTTVGCTIGSGISSNTATGIVNVNNGTLTISSGLTVGSIGTGTLNISNGGLLTTAGSSSSVGDINGSGTVIVDGAGSTWQADGALYVGGLTGFGVGTLQITNGGKAAFTSGSKINTSSSSALTSKVIVDGKGSSLSFGGELDIERGSLSITNGGSVSNTLGEIMALGSPSGEVTVDGAGSIWTNTGRLDVDRFAKLTITNGGTVVGSGSITAMQGDLWADSGTLNTTAFIGFGTVHVSNSGLILYRSGLPDGSPYAGSNFVGKVVDGTAPGQLSIYGNGTTMLTSANTYSGGTIIGGGTIIAASTGLGSGVANLLSGATLSVGSKVNIGYTAATTNTLSVTSLVWNAGSTLTFNLGASGVSDSMITDALTFSGSGDFRVAFASATGANLDAGIYTLITVNSTDMPTVTPTYTTTGNLASLSGPAVFWHQNGNSWQLILAESGGTIVTPEPGSLCLMLPAGIGLALSALRKRRHSRLS